MLVNVKRAIHLTNEALSETKAIPKTMASITKKVLEAADSGEYHISMGIPHYARKHINTIITKVKDEGYSIRIIENHSIMITWLPEDMEEK